VGVVHEAMSNAKVDAKANTQSTLIFVHIPKAAGMTMRQIVGRQYIGQPVYMFNQKNTYQVEPFLALPAAERAALRCVSGHVHYGLHRYLEQPCTYITLVRDPYDHLISTYYFFRRDKELPANIEKAFESYLQRPHIPSLQLDWIVGYDEQAAAGIVDNSVNQHLPVAEKLAIAERHLREDFASVGLVERFDESLLLMRRRLGWGSVYYTRKHYNAARPRGADTAALRALIDQYAQPDLQFYALAKTIFEEQCRAYSDGLAADLQIFQRNNRIYNRVMMVSESVRQTGVYRGLRLLTARLRGR
jgi:hypothetical protein